MSAQPRRLVILRHGVTSHNAAGIWQGHLDTELTADGLAQAEAVAEVLGGSRVFSRIARLQRPSPRVGRPRGWSRTG